MKNVNKHLFRLIFETHNCSQFYLIFETESNFLIAFLRLILGKVEVDGFAGPRLEIDIRYEFDFKMFLKDLLCK